MTAVTLVGGHNQALTPEVPIIVDELTITSDYTYTPSARTGKTIHIISCYNNTDGASVVCTLSSGVITMGNGQSLAGKNVILTYTYLNT